MSGTFLFVKVVLIAIGPSLLLAVNEKETFNCELRYSTWYYPELLKVNWTLPDYIRKENINYNITWYTDQNKGTCDVSSLTTCTWHHGSSGVNFYIPFYLTIMVMDRRRYDLVLNKTFLIDPLVNCSKPPIVDDFSVTPVNSSCVDVRWEYWNKSGCTFLDNKLYVIHYRADTSWMTINTAFEESTTSCKGSRYVCGLHPFTTYTFDIRVKAIDYGTTGHFSDSVIKIIKTFEKAPGEAPVLPDGAWSYNRHDCNGHTDRTISLFWQDLSEDKKNGFIIDFIVAVRHAAGLAEYRYPGNRYSGTVTLRCDTEYRVTMTAANSAGVSPESATIVIQSFDSRQTSSVEQVISEVSGDMIRVYWLPRVSNKDYIVIWCLKHIEHHCQSSINWTTLSSDKPFSSVAWQPGTLPDQYSIAVATRTEGATWADCLYIETEMQPPQNVKVSRDTSMLDGTLVVTWNNDKCGNDGPYIRYFQIVVCEVNSEHSSSCINSQYTMTVDGRNDMQVFQNLEPDALYKVEMKAIGLHNKTSTFSNAVFGRSVWHGRLLSSGVIALFVIIGVVLVICATYAIYKFKMHLCRRWEKIKEANTGIKIPVNLPDIEQKQLITNV